MADLAITDALDGIIPSWRMVEEPIYLSLVEELGIPGLDLGPCGIVMRAQ